MFRRTCVWEQRGVGCPTRVDAPGAESDHSTGRTVPLSTTAQSLGPWEAALWVRVLGKAGQGI